MAISPAVRDNRKFRKVREQCPTSNYHHTTKHPSIPPVFARNPRRRNTWVKAQAHYSRDRERQVLPTEQMPKTARDMEVSPKATPVDFGPKRKHPAFLLEEEPKCLMEDHVGTPHISELHVDDDENTTQLKVEELSVGGEVGGLDITGNLIKGADTADLMSLPEIVTIGT